ncbi:hypothetical protein [Acinetobacter nematophilus]|uniref:DUF1963 domain-containing protein n=1 Tax=Acinetobacter nematophilus TaxID=2994642 RepID=A0A9X3DYR4_9GAMM|nr:hypothetical protein [Acinetobacter nematophilus]MCX5467264.1 hypothetical protein [Acinetobacter nematophilus]
MKENAENLIADFKEYAWKLPNLYERLFEFIDNEEAAFIFCRLFLMNFEKGATIFNDSLSYVDKASFSKLIVKSLDILKQQRNENAEAVIEYASLQFPELLHPYLETIFELKPNQSAFYAEYPWRNLPVAHIQPFIAKIKDPMTPRSDQQKLYRCLIETRDLQTLNFAYQFARENNIFESEDSEAYLLEGLESVGFTVSNGQIENYCPNPFYHFKFPENYFHHEHLIYLNKTQHPTWRLKPIDKAYAFGGLIQDDEHNPFIHLITFDEIPNDLSIKSLKSLTLGMHIRELNEYSEIFYQHNQLGKPTKMDNTTVVENYPDLAIKNTQICLSETPSRWAYQSWGSSNGRENLFRLGGEPTWIQGAQVLICPICNKKMNFLMQLDSDLPAMGNGEVYFGSGGICYVFWCDQSQVSGYLVQCT